MCLQVDCRSGLMTSGIGGVCTPRRGRQSVGVPALQSGVAPLGGDTNPA